MLRKMHLKKNTQLVLALLILLPLLIEAEQKANLNGRWKCIVKGLGADELEAILSLNQEDKNLTGNITVNGNSYTLSEVTLENYELGFTVITEEHQYKSTADLIGNKLIGKWNDESGNGGNWEAVKELVAK